MIGILSVGVIMTFNYLLGLQALLNLQYLPSEFSAIINDMVANYSLSYPQVAAIWFSFGTLFGVTGTLTMLRFGGRWE